MTRTSHQGNGVEDEGSAALIPTESEVRASLFSPINNFKIIYHLTCTTF